MKWALDIRSVDDLNAVDLPIDEIEDYHALIHLNREILVCGSVRPFRLWRSVERRAKVIAAPTAVNNRKLCDLGCQVRSLLCSERDFEFLAEGRKRMDKCETAHDKSAQRGRRSAVGHSPIRVQRRVGLLVAHRLEEVTTVHMVGPLRSASVAMLCSHGP